MSDLPKTDALVRLEYWLQLNEKLDEMQDEWDWSEAQALVDHPEIIDKPWFNEIDGRLDFMCELFNYGRLEFMANVVRFHHPDWFVLDHRIMDLIGAPDVVWSYPSVRIGDDGMHMVVEITMIDSQEDYGPPPHVSGKRPT